MVEGSVSFTLMPPWVIMASLKGRRPVNVKDRPFVTSVYNGKKELYRDFGEMLFTHFGVSGPVILSASSFCAKAVSRGPLKLMIDLKPDPSAAPLGHRVLKAVPWATHTHV